MQNTPSRETINPLFLAGQEFQRYFQTRHWPFCFIGGLAVIRWGELRMTQDIDLCLLCGFGNEEKYIDALLKDFKARIPDSHKFALTNRVLLLYAFNDVSVDITLSGIPFENLMICRSTPFFYIPEFSLITCSSEDLVVLKAFANRSVDWMDIEGIVMRQEKNLDIAIFWLI